MRVANERNRIAPSLKEEGWGGFALLQPAANPLDPPFSKGEAGMSDTRIIAAGLLPPLKKEGWGGFALLQPAANPFDSPFKG
jgi:hypothetical protein